MLSIAADTSVHSSKSDMSGCCVWLVVPVGERLPGAKVYRLKVKTTVTGFQPGCCD